MCGKLFIDCNFVIYFINLYKVFSHFKYIICYKSLHENSIIPLLVSG
jgi:hypothetical protein